MGVQEREDGRKFEMASAESVKNPSHYKIKGLKEESIEVIRAIVNHNARSMWEAVLLKDCLKYLFRYGKKNGVEDLQKAKVYLEWLIEEVENEKNHKKRTK